MSTNKTNNRKTNNRKKRENYNAYPKRGVTVATLSGVQHDFISAMEKLTSRNSRYFEFFGYANLKDAKLKDVYTGIARLNTDDGDVWNEAIGKKVAVEKAKSQYHRDFDRLMVKTLEDLRRLEASMLHYCSTHHIDTSSVKTAEEFKGSMFTPPQPQNP